MDTIIPESTEQEVSVEQENATFFVLGDAAYTSEIIEEYNRNAENKTNEFNSNSDAKVKEYNTNATNKTTAFNSNYDTKVADFNKNAETQTETFNSNATTQVNSFNANATTSIQNYNANAEQKLYEFNANALSYEEGITDNSNRVKRLETDIFDSGEASGTSINIKDSTLAEFQEISVDGVCNQVTTTGKNKFNYLAKNPDSSGLTTVINEDGSMTTSGLLTSDNVTISYEDITNKLEDGEYYTYSMSEISTKIYLQLTKTNLETNEKDYISLNAIKSSYFFVDKSKYRYTMKVVSCPVANWGTQSLTIKNTYQLEKGQVATDFEPYTGGQQSPSQDYPQEIQVIGNSFQITSCNKNLFNVSKYLDNNYVSQKLFIPVGEYTVKYIGDNSDGIYVRKANGTTPRNGTPIIDRYNINQLTFTITESGEYYIQFYKSKNGFTLFENAQLEKGTQATPYEQHLETQITANLPDGKFVGKLNETAKDQVRIAFNEEDGKYHAYLDKNIDKKVLNETEDFIAVDREGVKVFIYEGLRNKIYKSSTNKNLISTHYKSVKDIESNISNSIRSNNNGQIFITIVLKLLRLGFQVIMYLYIID